LVEGKLKMALGLNIGSAGGGKDFLPIIKYDARAGRIFRMDREDGVSTPVDITRNFKAVFDFENLEVGYLHFAAGSPPDFQMVPFGSALPAQPSKDHKQGIRVCVKLGGEIGGDVRELAGNSGAFISGIDALHDAYMSGLKQNPGKLPVVGLADTLAIESKGQGLKSTNYRPVFEILSWVSRPKDLVASPRSSAEPVAVPNWATPAPTNQQPATGATRASAPAPKKVEEDVEDFG
jgi:hypothetical protein